MKKTVITFGLLSGLIIILYSVAVFLAYGDFSKLSASEFEKVEKLGYLRYLILFLTIIFAIRYFKKQKGGVVTFGQAFRAGMYTALVVALLVGLMELVYMLANPGFMDQYAEISTKKMAEQGASAAEIESRKKEMENYKWLASPAGMGIFYFLETFILGTIMSLLTSLFVRSRNRQTVAA